MANQKDNTTQIATVAKAIVDHYNADERVVEVYESAGEKTAFDIRVLVQGVKHNDEDVAVQRFHVGAEGGLFQRKFWLKKTGDVKKTDSVAKELFSDMASMPKATRLELAREMHKLVATRPVEEVPAEEAIASLLNKYQK